METNPTDFRVKEGEKVDLHDWPTEVDPVYNSKKAYKKLLRKHVARLIVSRILVETLEGLEMSYPQVSEERQKELQSIRDNLAHDDVG